MSTRKFVGITAVLVVALMFSLMSLAYSTVALLKHLGVTDVK